MATSCVVLPSPGISAWTISILPGSISALTIERMVIFWPRRSRSARSRPARGSTAHPKVGRRAPGRRREARVGNLVREVVRAERGVPDDADRALLRGLRECRPRPLELEDDLARRGPCPRGPAGRPAPTSTSSPETSPRRRALAQRERDVMNVVQLPALRRRRPELADGGLVDLPGLREVSILTLL